MKNNLIIIVIFCSIIVVGSSIASSISKDSGRVFYVDSTTGSDINHGTTPEKAWESLEKINSITFNPGDKILFRAGTIYTGQLKPRGSGKENAPIIIDMYGVGSKPRIDGKGIHIDTVLLENVEFWEVNNLEITNFAPNRMEWQTGLKVFSNGFGTMRHIHLKNLYVHDVNGNLEKSAEGCGIYALSAGKKLSRFDGLLIQDCHVVRTDRNGICMRSEFTNRSQNWFPSLNVVIRRNVIEDCGGDGIKPWGVDGCLVEYNTINGARMRCSDHAAGIWPWSADNTIIQYNEVCNVKGTKDGQGFDSDYNCRNTIFQYNYSHDNDGGFILVCSKAASSSNVGNIDTIIRYNISQNDADAQDSRVFQITGELDGTYIYNNVIYAGKNIDTQMVMFANWDKKFPKRTYFYNNIFYSEGKVSYKFRSNQRKYVAPLNHDFLKKHDIVFSDNVFFGNHVNPPYDPHAITDDPMLVKPGSGSMGINSLGGYKIKSGSPCIGTGKLLKDSGQFDYWGNKLNQVKHSIGAHEFSALVKYSSFKPDTTWFDDNGMHINAHGGGILDYDGIYYWFGEHKVKGRIGNTAQVGVHCYSSKDLYNWKDEGIALAVSASAESEIVKGSVIERPKVIYNKKTDKFVMWFHLELKGQGYSAARTGVAVSNSVTGPYKYLRSYRPNASDTPLKESLTGNLKNFKRDFKGGQMARDMTLFVDDDGKAYHIHSSEENYTLHISQLSDDYLSFSGKFARVFPGGHNEAPAICKYQGKYYMISSGCTGWRPNTARSALADSIWGPWKELGNPCKGTNPHNNLSEEKTFGGQSTFILPVRGKEGAIIAMFDVWTPKNPIDGRYIWLPVSFKDNRITVQWHDDWDLSLFK